MVSPQLETVKSQELVEKLQKKYAGKIAKETIAEIIETYNKGIHDTLVKGKKFMIFGVVSFWPERNPARRYLALPLRETVVGKEGWRISAKAGTNLTNKLNTFFGKS